MMKKGQVIVYWSGKWSLDCTSGGIRGLEVQRYW